MPQEAFKGERLEVQCVPGSTRAKSIGMIFLTFSKCLRYCLKPPYPPPVKLAVEKHLHISLLVET